MPSFHHLLLLASASGLIVPPPAPLAAHAAPAASALLAAVDPFLDPVWVGTQAQPVAHAAQVADHGPVVTGVVVYAVSMIALTWWDDHMLPKLQDAGILPEMPDSLRARRLKALSKEQRALPWLTPVTADRTTPLPPLERIEKEAVRVGACGGVTQYIKAHTEAEAEQMTPLARTLAKERPDDGTPFDADELCAVCMVSQEWTEYYGGQKNIYLCKRKTENGKFGPPKSSSDYGI